MLTLTFWSVELIGGFVLIMPHSVYNNIGRLVQKCSRPIKSQECLHTPSN